MSHDSTRQGIKESQPAASMMSVATVWHLCSVALLCVLFIGCRNSRSWRAADAEFPTAARRCPVMRLNEESQPRPALGMLRQSSNVRCWVFSVRPAATKPVFSHCYACFFIGYSARSRRGEAAEFPTAARRCPAIGPDEESKFTASVCSQRITWRASKTEPAASSDRPGATWEQLAALAYVRLPICVTGFLLVINFVHL